MPDTIDRAKAIASRNNLDLTGKRNMQELISQLLDIVERQKARIRELELNDIFLQQTIEADNE